MKQLQRNYKRVVIKIGSSLLFSSEKKLDTAILQNICEQAQGLSKDGREVVIVSSGAIAFGMHLLDLKERPKNLNYLQSASAIGQNELMNTYRRFFKDKFRIAQILLTWEDFNDRSRYLNAKNTISTLLKLKCIPIINENDTVSTDEIKFGDNDRLSALVASLICADLLLILSDVDGLLDKDKKVVRVVTEITPQIKGLACSTKKKTSVGGMITKIEAAKIAMDSGTFCIIANGRKKEIISSALNKPEESGTFFVSEKGLCSRRQWIAFGAKPKGVIIVDDGAKQALINKKSLLSVGILGCAGVFNSGDIVRLKDRLNYEFARGRVGRSASEIDKVKGKRSEKEIIHCDNIVVL
ncbi:MAG: glutamate 5-kinase [Candidatus Omnitrophota bacterium]|nr:glutamate 5-kinase [Candidatus Omnitrophota bacterium]